MSARPAADGNGKAGAAPRSVYVVDDHPGFLRAVAPVIAATPGFELIGTAGSGQVALDELVGRDDVALVLIDVNMPGVGGIETARRYQAAGGRAVVVLMSTTDPADLPAFTGVAAGFLQKESLSSATLRQLWDAAVAAP